MDGKPKYIHESYYIAETFIKICNIEELPDGILPLKFTTIRHYQWEYYGIHAKILCKNIFKELLLWRPQSYYTGNVPIKMFIPQKLQKYVLHWYHTYLLNPGLDRTKAIILQHL